MKRTRYTISVDRDAKSGWWVAQAREVPAAITQGRTIAEARRRMSEALALALDDDSVEKAELTLDVHLDGPTHRALVDARRAREKLEVDRQRAQASTLKALRLLTRRLRLSNRDAAELLGLSHQRVQQLTRSG